MIEICVSNQIGTADIWVLPDTKENRGITAWGKATIAKSAEQDDKTVAIPAAEGRVRMIDTDEMYYEVDGVAREAGQSLVIREGEEDMTAVVEAYDAEGTLVAEYPIFMARL